MRPHNEIATKEESLQIPLFITDIPKKADLLTEKNIADLTKLLSPMISMSTNNSRTLAGDKYLKLFSFASDHKISHEVLHKYLSIQGITISSNLPPEQPGYIRFN